MKTETLDLQAKRVRDLLRTYYGTEDEDDEKDVSCSTEEREASSMYVPTIRPDTIDDNGFDATGYVDGLIREERLPKLFEIHSKMASEVKQLDCDMQALVYENYNKFIAATETIRTLRRDVEGMEGTCDKLQQAMKEVQESSMVLGGSESEESEEIGRLQDLKMILDDIKHVEGLPIRLRELLDANDLERVAMEAKDVVPLLREMAMEHPGTILAVSLARVEYCVEQAKEMLLDRLLSTNKDDEVTSKTVDMLVGLGMDVDSLEEEYFQPLTKDLLDSMRSISETEGVEKSIVLERLTNKFCDHVSELAVRHEKYFSASDRDVPNALHVALEAFARIVRSLLCTPPLSSTSDLVASLDALVGKLGISEHLPTKQCLETNAKRISRLCIFSYLETKASLAGEGLIAALCGVEEDCHALETDRKGPTSRMKGSELFQSAREASMTFVGSCIATVEAFGEIIRSAVGYKLTGPWREELFSHVVAIQANLMENVADRILLECGVAGDQSNARGKQSVEHPQDDSGDLPVARLGPQKKSASTLFLVICAQVLKELVEDGLPQITSALNGVEVGMDTQTKGTSELLEGTSAKLLQAHGSRHQAVLDRILCSTVEAEGLGSLGHPSGVGPAVLQTEEEIMNTYCELAAVLGGDDLKSPVQTLDEVSALERDVARMFDSRLPASQRAGATSLQLALQVAKSSFQAWEQSLKRAHLSKESFWQLQVDCGHLKRYMNRFVDSTVSDQLLDRIVEIGKDRCMDPDLLDEDALQKLVSSSVGDP